jgi:ribonuclease P protein component
LTLTFPKASRLLKKSDFQRVYHKGTKLFGSLILVYANSTDLPTARLGISVPKRFGKSHDRNFFKRQIRETFRLLIPNIKPYDLHVIPLKMIEKEAKDTLKEEFAKLLTKLSETN